jgi:hypothetical protein
VWRARKKHDRPHGLDIVAALTGPGGWGSEQAPGNSRVVWATLEWTDARKGSDMKNTWETTVRTAANTMLRYREKLSDGLEAELYALLEKLGTADTGEPSTASAQQGLTVPEEAETELAAILLAVLPELGHLMRIPTSSACGRRASRRSSSGGSLQWLVPGYGATSNQNTSTSKSPVDGSGSP